MGRKPLNLDIGQMLDLLTDGCSKEEIAEVMGVSVPTINNRIEALRKAESSLLAYEKNQHLDIIAVQQRLIAGVTDEKIEAAPLQHIASAFGTFKKAEQLVTGRPTEIHGLMGYLLHLDKEDIEKKELPDATVIEAEDATKTA
jgi:DNA-binding Lrp family transcriptional regulator